MNMLRNLLGMAGMLPALAAAANNTAGEKPNIIFVMADDMGWGQTGYRGHPVLKTAACSAWAGSNKI